MEEICLENERVESKMKPRFLAKGVGEIDCALCRERERRVDNFGCLVVKQWCTKVQCIDLR